MKIMEISPRGRSKLFLKHEDGVAGVVELAGKGVFTAWLQNGVFEQVRLSKAGHPEWPGESTSALTSFTCV